MIIKIDDGYCEWTFVLENTEDKSINDIVEFITKNSDVVVANSYLSVSAKEKVLNG